NFSQWFETRALQEDVPDLIKQLSRGPNSVAKSYSGYLINGYRFHVRQRDARRKTQNSGVTLIASPTSFASSRDKNPTAVDFTYNSRIIDIVKLNYYNHFKVVLFKCDWYEVEKDVYGLTYVYFNKRCSQEEPFVLASQSPSISKDNGEVLLTKTDIQETIIDVPVEEFFTQQLEVEYEEEFEDVFEDESENEYEDEFSDAFENESEN
ncbi:hypothetical protein EJD97_000170, partial [Solanum chilense]